MDFSKLVTRIPTSPSQRSCMILEGAARPKNVSPALDYSRSHASSTRAYAWISSGLKKSGICRFALSSESDPWMMFGPNVRSAISGPFLRLFRGLRGRRGSFLFFLLRLLPLAPLHFGPLSVEPGLEDAAAFLGVLPGRELGLFDVGHRLRAVLLLGPAEDRRPEGWALDEGREEFLDLSSREVRTEPFVDQVGEVRRDVLALRRLDRRLAGGGLGGRGHLLGDDRLFGRGPSRRAAERLRPRRPTRHPPEVEQVRLAFVGAEQEDGPILPDEHLAGARLDLVAAEGTGTAGGHRLTGPRACGPRGRSRGASTHRRPRCSPSPSG